MQQHFLAGSSSNIFTRCVVAAKAKVHILTASGGLLDIATVLHIWRWWLGLEVTFISEIGRMGLFEHFCE